MCVTKRASRCWVLTFLQFLLPMFIHWHWACWSEESARFEEAGCELSEARCNTPPPQTKKKWASLVIAFATNLYVREVGAFTFRVGFARLAR